MRLRNQRQQKSDLPPYLTKNNWEQELNYKLWITKGARFAAARRCEDLDAAGLWATTILSAYLIIVGLIPYIPHPIFKDISQDLLSFGTAALSIILMAVTLLISMRQYPLQARAFHECSLKIGVLYDRLRQAKEIENEEAKRAQIAAVTRDYEELLPKYANHQPIDLDMFKTLKAEYFKVGWWWCVRCNFRYYRLTKAMLHSVIAGGVLMVVIIAFRIDAMEGSSALPQTAKPNASLDGKMDPYAVNRMSILPGK
ncbi:hypothetical protein BGE01nite_01860 [Brevifollis gellanilyticus]|uniref:SMODS and SLOG-associating 2TM effector domain-containing protein n=1 Tax=Brevifollis gellanilyticus TaxID=748831 RepID=A0A512M2D4_9BACT|nr:hypothetical protein BGE01nite_01860 [Brevifollis gellanilyticus]